ncbi:MAG: HTTM domain-containing protein [Aliishimia sp.]
MSFETALRLIEIGVSLAIIQRAAEHFNSERLLFAPSLVLAVLLLAGVFAGPLIWGLWGLAVMQLARFNGPYNGGSDKMTLLILSCLSLVYLSPSQFWADMALSYLAVQLVLSYFVSGWVKIRNSEWRSGQALVDVFELSVYPVSENLTTLSRHAPLLLTASWSVILFEVAFPLSLMHPILLGAALCAAAVFHVSNAVCFGLNRFVWAWISAFPALIWFQDRMFG